MKANYTGHVADNVITDETERLPPGFHDCRVTGHQGNGVYLVPSDPYTTIGQQVRAELDREAEAVAYLEARGYKVIKREGS